VAIDPMNGMISSYLASPKGQEMIKGYMASTEGRKSICNYLATPEGKQTLQQILPCILEGLNLSPETRARITGDLQKPQ